MKECKKCGSEDVAKVGEIYIKEVEYDCPDCGTGFLIQEDRIRDRLYTQKEVDQIKQEERRKTLEEVIKMEAFETSQDSGENYGSGVIIVDEVKEKLKLLKKRNEK